MRRALTPGAQASSSASVITRFCRTTPAVQVNPTARAASEWVSAPFSMPRPAAIVGRPCGISAAFSQPSSTWQWKSSPGRPSFDPIAERIRSIGHVAPGSYAEIGRLGSLPDAPAKPPKAMKMVRILMEGHEAVARTARGLLPVVESASDEPTADILVQRLTVHEQTAWMLRSLLED